MDTLFKMLLILNFASVSVFCAADDSLDHPLSEGKILFKKNRDKDQKVTVEPIEVAILGHENVILSLDNIVISGNDILFDSSRFLIYVKALTKIEREKSSLVFSLPRCAVINTIECSISDCGDESELFRTPNVTLKNIDLCDGNNN